MRISGVASQLGLKLANTFSSTDARVGQQTAWLWCLHAVQILSSAIGMALAARMLGLELYGVLALFIGLTGLVGGLLYAPGDELISTYVTRELAAGRRAEAGEVLRFAFLAAIVSRVLGFAAVAALTVFFGPWLGIPEDERFAMYVYATILIGGAAQSECLAVLRLADKLAFGFAAGVASALVLLAGLAVAWWVDGGIRYVAFAYAAHAAIWGAGLFLGALAGARTVRIPLLLHLSPWRIPRDMVSFQAAAFLKSSFKAMYLSLDVVLLAQLTTSAQVGAYRAARLIADVALRPFYATALTLQVEFARHWYAGDRANLRRLAKRFTGASIALATVGFGFLAVFHPWVITVALGDGYASAAAPLLVMILGSFILAATMPLHVLPAAAGHGWPHSLASLAALAAQIMGIFLLAPGFGAYGAAFAYTAYSFVLVAALVPIAIAILRRTNQPSPMAPVRPLPPPPRIALFTLNLAGGGAERALLDMAGGMARRGRLVDLVVAHATGPLIDLIPEGVRLVDLKAWRIEVSHLSLLRYLRRERPAALISTLPQADLVALVARRFLHKDILLIVRVASTMSKDAARRRLPRRVAWMPWRRLLPSADAVVANSVGATEDLERFVPPLRHTVRTIHNPVVWPHIAKQAAETLDHPWFEDGVPVILSAGRLVPAKGHETALRAFAEVVKSRPAHFMILGEGPDQERLVGLTHTLKVAHLVDFAGFQINPFAYMARAAVFVLASSYEGLPNVLIQAMACGTPVVSTDCPSGPREILDGGKWGQLVPVANWRALAAAILHTLDAPVDRDALTARASAYDGESSVDQYMALLQEFGR